MKAGKLKEIVQDEAAQTAGPIAEVAKPIARPFSMFRGTVKLGPKDYECHHQWLKRFGRQRVNDQIQRVIAVMKFCVSMDDFREKFATVFKKSPMQLSFDDLNWSTN